jgi:hypothetical protein
MHATNAKVSALEGGVADAVRRIEVQKNELEEQSKLAAASAKQGWENQQNLDAALGRFGSANFAAAPAKEDDESGSARCGTGPDPAVVSVGDDLEVGACKGALTISTVDCSVDPCVLQNEVDKIKLMVGLDD